MTVLFNSEYAKIILLFILFLCSAPVFAGRISHYRTETQVKQNHIFIADDFEDTPEKEYHKLIENTESGRQIELLYNTHSGYDLYDNVMSGLETFETNDKKTPSVRYLIIRYLKIFELFGGYSHMETVLKTMCTTEDAEVCEMLKFIKKFTINDSFLVFVSPIFSQKITPEYKNQNNWVKTIDLLSQSLLLLETNFGDIHTHF